MTSLLKTVNRLADFLASRERAVEILRGAPEWQDHSEREWERMYDYCFRGCVRIPAIVTGRIRQGVAAMALRPGYSGKRLCLPF